MDLKRTNIKNITYYVMSSNDTAGTEAGQYWSTTEEWPELAPTSYYLHADGTASTEGKNEVEGEALISFVVRQATITAALI